MNKYIFATVISLLFIFSPSFALTQQTSLTDLNKFTTDFCNAQSSAATLQEKTFLMAANIFTTEKQTINCPKLGDFILQKMVDSSDPGHYIYSIDASPNNPAVQHTLDCDAKADMGMEVIGLNCFPVNREKVTHQNPN